MDTLLRDGKPATDLCGLPIAVSGEEELVQRCLIRLVTRRGSFAPDPTLGSRLRSLPKASPEVLQGLAAACVREALEDMPYVSVTELSCRYQPEQDCIDLALTLVVGTQAYNLEVKL